MIGLLAAVLLLLGCGRPSQTPAAAPTAIAASRPALRVQAGAAPAAIAELALALDDRLPKVTVLSPQPDEVLTDTTATVRFRVQDLPIYKDDTWDMGPHLHILLDNQQTYAVYDPNTVLTLTKLAPGTHTLRVLAAKPWHESFKNEAAYAQVTFHVLAPTGENQPQAGVPLLTYSQPEGYYGAEPVLLDFYLTDAPLHLVAQASAVDDVKDWQIRCTVNGEDMLLDIWEPVYLTGLKPGQNWVRLTLEDENGQPIANAFNSTVRLVEYEPGGEDGLAKLMRGELSATELTGIVDPSYSPPAPPESAAVAPAPSGEVETLEPSPSDDTNELTQPTLAEPEPAEPELTEPQQVEPELAKPEIPKVSEPELAAPQLRQADLDLPDSERGDPEPVEPPPAESQPVPSQTEPAPAEEGVPSAPGEAMESAIENLTRPETERELEPTAATPDIVPDIIDAIEADLNDTAASLEDRVEQAEPATEESVTQPTYSGRSLLKGLYDYRDRSLERYGKQ